MKEEKSNIWKILLGILIVIGGILLYPFKVSVDKTTGKTTCSNLIGMKYNCKN